MKRKKCMLFLAGITALLFVLGVTDHAEAKKTKLPKSIQLYSSGKKLGSSKTMNVGSTMKIKAKISPAQASQKVNFISTNKKIAAVSKTGKVEARNVVLPWLPQMLQTARIPTKT